MRTAQLWMAMTRREELRSSCELTWWPCWLINSCVSRRNAISRRQREVTILDTRTMWQNNAHKPPTPAPAPPLLRTARATITSYSSPIRVAVAKVITGFGQKSKSVNPDSCFLLCGCTYESESGSDQAPCPSVSVCNSTPALDCGISGRVLLSVCAPNRNHISVGVR
jgi:hypothetical protein